MEEIIDYLTTSQKLSLLDYELLNNDEFTILEEGDKIKLLNKSNHSFELKGRVTLITPYFIRIEFRKKYKIIYPNQYYIFYYKKPKSFRNQLEYLLEGLNKQNIKVYKK